MTALSSAVLTLTVKQMSHYHRNASDAAEAVQCRRRIDEGEVRERRSARDISMAITSFTSNPQLPALLISIRSDALTLVLCTC